MAGRTGVTRAEVAAAVQELRDRGERVSAVAVRGRLGRGSFTTIGKHLREIRAEEDALGLGAVDGRDLALPDPIARSLVAGAEGFWLELSQAADAIVEEAETRARERIAEAQAMEQTARRDAEVVRNERDALVEARDALSVEFAGLRRTHGDTVEQLRGVTGERDRLTERLVGAEQLSEERGSALEHARTLIAELRAEAADVGRRVEVERTDHGIEVSDLRSQIDRGVAELAAVTREREALQADLRGLGEVLETERSTRAELESENERVRMMLGEERDARSRAEAERSELAERSGVLERSVERLEGVVSGYRTLSESISAQFERVFGELTGVSSRLDDIARMRIEVSAGGDASKATPESSSERENS